MGGGRMSGMHADTRKVLDCILKGRQLLLQNGAKVDGLEVLIHPHDYMTLGLERTDLVQTDDVGRPLTVLRMRLVQELDIPIGQITVRQRLD